MGQKSHRVFAVAFFGIGWLGDCGMELGCFGYGVFAVAFFGTGELGDCGMDLRCFGYVLRCGLFFIDCFILEIF